MRSDDDTRIEQLLGEIARPPAERDLDVTAVLDSIEQRRRRHRRATRRRAVVTAAACLALLFGAVTWSRADRTVRLDTADAPATSVPTPPSRPDTGEVTPRPDDVLVKGQIGSTLDVPGDGSTVTVIGAVGDGVWIARSDGVDATAPVPATVTRLSPDGALGPTTELHGVPLLATAAADRVWIVTEDRVVSVTDPARHRLKEVDPSTGTVRSSTPLPEGVPAGLWTEDDAPVVRMSDDELVVDPETRTMSRRAALDQGAQVAPRVRSDSSAWMPSTMGSVDGVVHVGADGSRSILELPGAGAPVPAPAWGEGAAATLVHHPDRADLLALQPPTTSGSPPRASVRLTGLPADTELIAVGADRVWLQRGGRLAALPMT